MCCSVPPPESDAGALETEDGAVVPERDPDAGNGSPDAATDAGCMGECDECPCEDPCSTDNGGCGDPAVYLCIDNGGTEPTCVDIDDCADQPCPHGGTCVDGLGTYSCSCAPRFWGANCEHDDCGAQGGSALSWARAALGGTSWSDGVAALPDGSSFVSGGLTGAVAFGPGETNETSLASAGSFDVFVAKFAAEGELEWVRQIGGAGTTTLDSSVASLPDGSAVVMAWFQGGAVAVSANTSNAQTLDPAGSRDTLVARYDRNGELLWVTQIRGANDGAVSGTATSTAGDTICVAGGVLGEAVFGAGEPNETRVTSADSSSDDILLLPRLTVFQQQSRSVRFVFSVRLRQRNHRRAIHRIFYVNQAVPCFLGRMIVGPFDGY